MICARCWWCLVANKLNAGEISLLREVDATVFDWGGVPVELVLTEAAHRETIRGALSTRLQITGSAALFFPGKHGRDESVWKGMQLCGVGELRRHGLPKLLAALRQEVVQPPIVVVKSIDTEAVEQNWRQLNRHKATLRHAGPKMYLYLLHRVAHLLNIDRWDGQ